MRLFTGEIGYFHWEETDNELVPFMSKKQNTTDGVRSTHESLVLAFIVLVLVFIVLKVVFL